MENIYYIFMIALGIGNFALAVIALFKKDWFNSI